MRLTVHFSVHAGGTSVATDTPSGQSLPLSRIWIFLGDGFLFFSWTTTVFAALSGFVVLGDRMTTAQFAGCAMVFFAAVFTQIFDIIFSKKTEVEFQ